MPNDQKKFERFEKAVFTEVDLQAETLKAEVEAYRAKKLAESQDEELNASYRRIQKRADAIRHDFSQRATKARLDARQQLLRHRQQLVEQLFSDAAEQLRQYADTEDYRAAMAEKLANADNLLSGGIIYCREEDVSLFSALAPQATVAVDQQNRCGGFAIRNNKTETYLDETYPSKLEAQKARFYEQGGRGINL